MKKRAFGFFCVMLSAVFVIAETRHFGNNLFPGSWAELLCDVTALALTISGLLLSKGENR